MSKKIAILMVVIGFAAGFLVSSISFAEKPQMEEWISSGFFVFNRKVFDYLKGDDCVLEREPLERLAHDGELMAYKHHGFFYGMDTYRDYKFLNELWNSGQSPWKKWE